jgi:hypothetical protein
MSVWMEAAVPVAMAVTLLVLPGLSVRLAGWQFGAVGAYFFVPAISLAILAVSANVAHLLGIAWSFLPVIGVTVIAALAALLLRHWVRETPRRPGSAVLAAGAIGLLIASALIAAQLAFVFVSPQNISQTFDNIVHLNSIRFALDSVDASAFQIGATSDIGFYPNAWHSLVTLVAQLTGASVPVAINASNIAIGALVWPASTMALAAAYFGNRPAALASAAALSTGFGAFPILLLFFGVLYPNVTGYAVLPAGVAAVIVALRRTSRANAARSVVLLLVVCAAVGLGHPNAFLALYAIGSALTAMTVLRRAARRPSRAAWLTAAFTIVALGLAGFGLWRFSDTPYEMSRWGPWESTAQAFGEAVLMSPRQYAVTVPIAILMLLGLMTVIRRPVRIDVAIPFFVGATLFILVAGTGVGNPVRELLTRPWYNDPYRLAALLPIVGIPIATLGMLALIRFTRERALFRAPAAATTVSAVLVAALFTVAVGPNVTGTAQDARGAYQLTSDSRLLTIEERSVIERLSQTTPPDAIIAGNPGTGVALAYALAGRQVMERHIFGTRTQDELYVDARLDDIATDPRVCDAVRSTGVTHVLDFGEEGVGNVTEEGAYDGVQDLSETARLVLVDSEGSTARLFAIEGC